MNLKVSEEFSISLCLVNLCRLVDQFWIVLIRLFRRGMSTFFTLARADYWSQLLILILILILAEIIACDIVFLICFVLYLNWNAFTILPACIIQSSLTWLMLGGANIPQVGRIPGNVLRITPLIMSAFIWWYDLVPNVLLTVGISRTKEKMALILARSRDAGLGYLLGGWQRQRWVPLWLKAMILLESFLSFVIALF